MLIPGCIVQISCNKAISIHLMLMLIQTIQGGMSGYSLISIHLMLMLIFVLNGCLHTADTISIHLMLMLIGNHSHSFQMSLFDFNTSHVNVNLLPFLLLLRHYRHFNTSHVNVNRPDGTIDMEFTLFQYISC